MYFGSVFGELVCGGDVWMGGLSSFVLCWTGAFGLVRA